MDESTANQDQPLNDSSDEESSALLTRLRIIEDQPLDTRAEALAHVHDELHAQLESGDAGRTHA